MLDTIIMLAQIPLVSADLSAEESILQVTDVFNRLNQVTDSVFARINDRIDRGVDRMGRIDARIMAVEQKVLSSMAYHVFVSEFIFHEMSITLHYIAVHCYLILT